MRYFVFGIVTFVFLSFPHSLGAQTPSPEPAVNAEKSPSAEKSVSRQWKEMHENKNEPVVIEKKPFIGKKQIDADKEKLEKLKEEEKALPSSSWGDIRARREARKVRAERTKEIKELEGHGKVVPPEEKIPPVLNNARSRRQARVEKYELQKEAQELEQKVEKDEQK